MIASIWDMILTRVLNNVEEALQNQGQATVVIALLKTTTQPLRHAQYLYKMVSRTKRKIQMECLVVH